MYVNKLSEFVLVDFIPQSILKLQKLVIVRMKKRGRERFGRAGMRRRGWGWRKEWWR